MEFKNIYLVGIGGIGMSALARHFNAIGCKVAGYDKTPSSLTKQLEAEGMSIHFEDNIDLIGDEFHDKENTLVIYTPAIPKAHLELNYFFDNGFLVRKRADVLAWLTEGKTTIAVAGTHGKTSTAALIAHLLKTANIPFFGLLGGISVNYNTNYIRPENGEADIIVVEADEYDRSFLRLHPDVAIITAVEPDHLDIYGTFEKLKEAYSDFACLVKADGKLIVNSYVSLLKTPMAKLCSYSSTYKADCYGENIRISNRKYYFDATIGDIRIDNIEMGAPGRHNIENSLAAMGAIRTVIPSASDYFKEGLASFKGVWRRFEVIVQNEHNVYIDDYAHHPTEIEVTIQTVKELYPDKKITGIFQPHLFSRTRDLADEFAKSLSMLDELYLLPIYPARELPMEGVTSELILDKVTSPFKKVMAKEDILEEIKLKRPEVLLTIGAGDIDRLIPEIKRILL